MKPQKDDIVTPLKKVNRTTIGQEYKVIEAHGLTFTIVDDWGIYRLCYSEDFKLIKRMTIFEKMCNFVNKIFGIC